MSNLKKIWQHQGYDTEELYFEKVNRELIERIKARNTPLSETPETQQTDAKVLHFSSKQTQKKAA